MTVAHRVETIDDGDTLMRCCRPSVEAVGGRWRHDQYALKAADVRCRSGTDTGVDVLGVAAPHGPAVVWYATRRVHARMGDRLLVVCRYAVCLGDVCLRDCWAFCSGPGVCLRDCWAYSSGGGGGSQRSDVALAGIVDVLGVAAPHGPG
ncbi:hypothetical protein TGGT1_410890, partial [Toxoplasma gondii GT1]